MDEKLATAMSYSTLWEAEMALSRLESENVAAYLKDGETVNMNWLLSNAVGGVKIQVADSDLQKAKEILSTSFTVDTGVEDWPDDGIECPRCQNQNIKYIVKGRRWTFLTWVLFGIPLLWPGKRLFCQKCGYKWREPDPK